LFVQIALMAGDAQGLAFVLARKNARPSPTAPQTGAHYIRHRASSSCVNPGAFVLAGRLR
jgi:hypothetical protein